MTPNLALQIDQIECNGLLEDQIGEAKFIDHFHNFLFTISLRDLEKTYNNALNNSYLISNQRNHFDFDNFNFKLFNKLIFNLDRIKETLGKISSDSKDNIKNYRNKRGLVNGLGTIVKFITGNLDDSDLQTITENIDNFRNIQHSQIEKINQLTSLANHITSRLDKQTQQINENLEITQNYIHKLQDNEKTRILIQDSIYQTEEITHFLETLERTITLSLYELPNLEIITNTELLEMQNYLKKIYSPEQLFHFDQNHLFKLLESSKLTIVGTNNTINFLLKIPILKTLKANYSLVYPIPNKDNLLIIPPRRYLVTINKNQLWTDETCKTTDSLSICSTNPIQDSCTINSISECETLKASNNYLIVKALRNQQLLVVAKEKTKIVENCQEILTQYYIQGQNLLSTECKIIIQGNTYSNTVPRFKIDLPNTTSIKLQDHNAEIDFKLKHLNSFEDLKKEASQIQPSRGIIIKSVHYTSSITATIIIIILIILAISFKQRIKELFCYPRRIVNIQKPEDTGDGA